MSEKRMLLIFLTLNHFCLGMASTCSPERKEFGGAFVDKVLSGPVLLSFTSAGEISCQHSCHFHNLCYQYNFHSGTNRCEILDGRSSNLKVKQRSGWIFKAQKCDTNVCQNNGSCYMNKETKCVCPLLWVGETCEQSAFVKINVNPVCFGAKDDTFGSFTVQRQGQVLAIKLVHVSGFIINGSGRGKFGTYHLETIMTDTLNKIIFPPSTISMNIYGSYNLPGYHYNSPALIFFYNSVGFSVENGKVLRIWEGEDLRNVPNTQYDNGGTSCIDVYFLFQP